MTTVKFSDAHSTESWVRNIRPIINRPCLVLLSGAMGSGKTQLVKWLLDDLQVPSANVASPTFAIHQCYSSPSGTVDHVDLYRLKSDQDLESTGFWEILRQDQGLIFVEWADRLPESVWPTTWQKIFINLKIDPALPEARTVEMRIVPASENNSVD